MTGNTVLDVFLRDTIFQATSGNAKVIAHDFSVDWRAFVESEIVEDIFLIAGSAPVGIFLKVVGGCET